MNNLQYKFLSLSEFAFIYNDEIQLFNQLQPLEKIWINPETDDIEIDSKTNKPLTDGENPIQYINLQSDNIYSYLNNTDNRIHFDTFNGYTDVFSIDKFLKTKFEPQFLTFWDRGVYVGAVWVLTDSEYFCIYGIRSSVANTVSKNKGIGIRMIQTIISYAESKKVVVVWPLPGIIPVLNKLGFKSEIINSQNLVNLTSPFFRSSSKGYGCYYL